MLCVYIYIYISYHVKILLSFDCIFNCPNAYAPFLAPSMIQRRERRPAGGHAGVANPGTERWMAHHLGRSVCVADLST